MMNISCVAFPIPEHAFFEQPILQHLLGERFFKLTGLAAQVFDLSRVGFPLCIAGQALLACLKENPSTNDNKGFG